MNKIQLIVFLWVALLFLAVQSVQAFDIYGTEHYDVIAPHTLGRLYDFSSADVLDSGQIDYAHVYNSAIINVTGGLVSELYTHDDGSSNISGGRTTHITSEENSTVNLLTGANVGQVYAWENSTVNIFDNISSGAGDALYAYGGSTVNIYGGRVNDIYTSGTGSITFYGYDFMGMDGLNLVDGHVLGTGVLTGKWLDGTYFSADILQNTATILAIPEPATFSLLALGAMLARKKENIITT